MRSRQPLARRLRSTYVRPRKRNKTHPLPRSDAPAFTLALFPFPVVLVDDALVIGGDVDGLIIEDVGDDRPEAGDRHLVDDLVLVVV